MRERVHEIAITDRDGAEVKLTEAKWQRLVGTLHDFEGWSSRLRSDFGAAPANFTIEHRLVEAEAADPAAAAEAIAALPPNGYGFEVLDGLGRRRGGEGRRDGDERRRRR